MRTSRLSATILFISALSNQFYADAGSAGEIGDQTPKDEPVFKPDPDYDHTNGLPSGRFFRLRF